MLLTVHPCTMCDVIKMARDVGKGILWRCLLNFPPLIFGLTAFRIRSSSFPYLGVVNDLSDSIGDLLVYQRQRFTSHLLVLPIFWHFLVSLPWSILECQIWGARSGVMATLRKILWTWMEIWVPTSRLGIFELKEKPVRWGFFLSFLFLKGDKVVIPPWKRVFLYSIDSVHIMHLRLLNGETCVDTSIDVI